MSSLRITYRRPILTIKDDVTSTMSTQNTSSFKGMVAGIAFHTGENVSYDDIPITTDLFDVHLYTKDGLWGFSESGNVISLNNRLQDAIDAGILGMIYHSRCACQKKLEMLEENHQLALERTYPTQEVLRDSEIDAQARA